MAQKRLCDSELSRGISFKQPRYMEHVDRNSPSSIVSSLKHVLDKAYLSGNGKMGDDKGLEKLGNEIEHVFPEDYENCNFARESETGSPCRCAICIRCEANNCEADKAHELVVHLPVSSEYFYYDRSGRHITSDDPYCAIFVNSPRKLVPVGPAHQADIPEYSENIATVDQNDQLGGIRITPASDHSDDYEPTSSDIVEAHVDVGRAGNCGCPDTGSTRCVRQHIMGARGKLKRMLGAVVFRDLGFYEMGEVVAEKWREEEEIIFHEVVHSNPASLGKNFWDILRLVFPSRTNMELVSYYFNVFILQKRAAQNRYDQMNIDSDDEWKPSDDNRYGYNNDSGGSCYEEDDSAVESPVSAGDHSHDLDGSDEHVEDNSHQSSLPSRVLAMRMGTHYHDVLDGSCTSFDFGFPSQLVSAAEAKGDCDEDWHGLGLMEPCGDVKAWESYTITSCPKTESVEFLPTCSVIEEVFGDGSSSLSFQSQG